MSFLGVRAVLLPVVLSVCATALAGGDRPPTGAAEALAEIGEAPDGRPLYLWNAGDSWSGGPLFDPRLDATVTFWGAGTPLSNVFDSLTEQTSVELGFYPPGDENARVCVTLYLSEDDPPTLRELVAQLSWVTACSFAFASDDDGEPAYFLLSTSIAGGAQENLQARVDAIWKARERRWREIGSKLEEYRQALDLSREELIERYWGEDDLLLLNLLDPPRRAATEFMCRHATAVEPPEMSGQEGGDLVGFGQTVPAAAFSEEDIADLEAAFGLPESVLRDPDLGLDLDVEAVGRLRVNVGPEYRQKAPQPEEGHFGPYLLADLTDDFVLPAQEELSLRRALGEGIPREQESDCLQKLEQEIASAKQARERARLEAERSLSPRGKEVLESTQVTLRGVEPPLPIPPWVAQEAVARETGLHVVSDAIVWSGRYSWPPYPPEEEKRETTLTALSALDGFTHEPLGTGMRRPSWEWGDAGRFLRFRTADRDIWRAAMLPQEFVDWVDWLIEPHLPDQAPPATRQHAELTIPVGLVYRARMLGRLSDLQMQFGAEANYGDPRDMLNIVRHQAITQILNAARNRPKLTRFLASLNDEQWEQMKGQGLRFEADLSPDQQEMLTAAMASSRRRYDLSGLVLTLDPKREAAGFYAVHLKGPGPRRERQGLWWDYSNDYAQKVLELDAWAPE